MKRVLIALVSALLVTSVLGSIALAGELTLPNGKTIEVPADEADNAGNSGIIEQVCSSCGLNPCDCIPPCVPPCDDGGI